MKIQGKIAHAVGALFFGSSDNWNFNASNPCLHFGGNYNQNGNHGLFYVNYNTASNSNANIGCRVLFGLATHLHSRHSKYPRRGANFLGTPWCRLAIRTRLSTLPQPVGARERS